jgi:hypothetical protein
MMIEPRLHSMKLAQLRIAAELQARGWPAVDHCEIYSYPDCEHRSWLAIVDLSDGSEVSAPPFVVPWSIDPDTDEEKYRRLNCLFWAGCKVHASVQA